MGLFSSKSSSSSSQTSNQYDMRIAAAAGSKNISSSASTVVSPDEGAVAVGGALVNSSVSILDSGAIERAFSFADKISREAMDSASMANLSAVDAVQEASGQLAKAWETAKAGEQKILVAGGLIIVGLVAIQALKGFGK